MENVEVTTSGKPVEPKAPPPSLGRIVMYVPTSSSEILDKNNGNNIAPAVVVRVWDNGVVNLKVLFDGTDNEWVTSVPYSEDKKPRTWHWPARI